MRGYLVHSTIRPAGTTHYGQAHFSERIQCDLIYAMQDCSASQFLLQYPAHKNGAGRGQRQSHSHDLQNGYDSFRGTIKIIENVRRFAVMRIPKVEGAGIPSILGHNADHISYGPTNRLRTAFLISTVRYTPAKPQITNLIFKKHLTNRLEMSLEAFAENRSLGCPYCP